MSASHIIKQCFFETNFVIRKFCVFPIIKNFEFGCIFLSSTIPPIVIMIYFEPF